MKNIKLFEEFVNEATSFGPKAYNIVRDRSIGWDWYTDAKSDMEENGGVSMFMPYQEALNKSKIKEEDAIVLYGYSSNDWQDVLSKLKKHGIDYVELYDEEASEPAAIINGKK